jgi:hypothetical protein
MVSDVPAGQLTRELWATARRALANTLKRTAPSAELVASVTVTARTRDQNADDHVIDEALRKRVCGVWMRAPVRRLTSSGMKRAWDMRRDVADSR